MDQQAGALPPLQVGLAHWEEGRWAEAARSAQEALRLQPTDASAWALLAAALAQQRQLAAAEQAALRALSHSSEHPEALRALASIRLRQRQLPQAEALALRAVEKATSDSLAWTTLANVRLAQGQVDAAIEALHRSQSIRESAEASAAWALIEAGRGHLQAAEAHAVAAVQRKPGLSAVWHLLSNIRQRAGRMDEAVQALRSGVEHDPANGAMLAELGEHLRRWGATQEALVLLQRAVAVDTQLPQAWVNYGTVLQELGQPQEAMLAYQKALALQPQLAEVHCNLGSLYKEARQLELAEQSYRSAIAAKPRLAQAHSSLGAVLRLQGRFEEAAAACREAIGCEAEFADPHDNLGIILKDMGRVDEALAEFRIAIILLMRRGQGRKAPPKAYMDVEVAHRALLAFKQAMDSERVPFFLAYGTLLGIVRDGELLPHDKDMDVGLAWDVDRAALAQALTQRHGFSLVEADVRGDESAAWNIALLHEQTGISIDLFFFKPDGDTLLSGIPQRPVPLLWRFSRFGTRDWTFLSQTWQVPDPPERYLLEIYGDGWRVPDAHFDSLISGRNRTPESLGVALCYAYNRLFDRLHRGEWTKAAGYCRQIQAQNHDPFINEVVAWLAARTAEQTRIA